MMTQEFRALKPLKIGDNEIWIDEIFTMPDDRDWLPLIKLELAELVNGEGKEISPQSAELPEPDTSFPEIVKAGPVWKKVMLGDEQIGKSVKTEEEAQAIIDEWLEEQKK